MERQIYIQWTNYPRQALLNCFYFDTKGAQNLDSFQQIPVWGEGTVPGLSSVGQRRLVIVCEKEDSSTDWYAVRNYADLCKHRFRLEDEDPARPQMVAEVLLEESVLQNTVVTLTPALTRIGLRSISADFRGKPYADEPFVVDAVYLGYAVTECLPLALGSARPAPLSWINAGEADSVALRKFPLPGMLWQGDIGPVGAQRQEISRNFYCYPGPQVRLVLAGRVGDDVCYYPVSVGPLQGGKAYQLDLTLTRKGSPSPDIPVQAGTVVVDSFTEPWETHETTYVAL